MNDTAKVDPVTETVDRFHYEMKMAETRLKDTKQKDDEKFNKAWMKMRQELERDRATMERERVRTLFSDHEEAYHRAAMTLKELGLSDQEINDILEGRINS
jgi:hypothetical protein